jgi:hypothetical protein
MSTKISETAKLAKMQDDLNANKTNVTCTSATVTKFTHYKRKRER